MSNFMEFLLGHFWIWCGLGMIGLIFVISYSVIKTNKKRTREIAELDQHFPEPREQSISVDKVRVNSKRLQSIEGENDRRDSAVEIGYMDEDSRDDIVVEDPQKDVITEIERVRGASQEEDQVEAPGRYKRSIFHPSHFNQEKEPKE